VTCVIAFPYHDWRKGQLESVRTRDGYLMRELGIDPRIETLLVVDRPVSLAERIASRRPWQVRGDQVGRRLLAPGWSTALTRVDRRTYVLDVSSPDLLGTARNARGWWFDVFDNRHVHAALDWGLGQLGLREPAAIAWTPAVAGTIRHLRPGRFVFDSLDNWITHPVLRRHAERASAAYAALLPTATAVVAPTETTRRELAGFGCDPIVLPNGVDIERFRRPGNRPPDAPDPPVVGYVGKLGVRLDVDLVVATAAAMPDVRFAFVGPALEPGVLRPLRQLPNIVLLGDRPADSVPAYLAAFDVAWIPHRVGDGETGGDLMKKYEYWAAGRQVVTTRVADLDAWASQLHVIASATEAVATIRALLNGSIRYLPTEVPTERTWRAIAAELLSFLDPSPSETVALGLHHRSARTLE
jgi:glycosyltransferase involved in cell wall biosynthesis